MYVYNNNYSSMNDKQHFSCAENGALQPFATQYPILPGTFSPTCSFSDIYSTLLPQSSVDADRSQNKTLEASYTFPELPAWDNLKLPEKIDLIELSSKDLSPSNYYTNIDTDNQYNRYEGPQWGHSSNNINFGQKPATYPSCAQVSKCFDNTNNSTYCSIQKSSVDREVFKSCAYYNSCFSQNKSQNCYTTFYEHKYADISDNACLYGPAVQPKPIASQKEAFDLNYLPNLDHPTEVSNDESDIVVEDSSSDGSEDQEPSLFYETTRCLVCTTQYTPLGLQFYVLTAKNPLTMSSQIPVKTKLSEFINNIFPDNKNYLCNDCLGLVNTIDHLQVKLDNLVKDLLNKLNVGCTIWKSTRRQKTRAKFGKYKCKKCNRILCVKAYLKNHVKNHKSRGFLCELCGKTSPTYKKFKNHFNVIHKKPKRTLISAFKCSNKFCDKIFRTKFHLKEHENFCLGLLPFKCKNLYCNKKFASSTKLRSHMKLKHDKKFMAICSICNIGFVKVSDYKSHMTTHSTDKKFACSKCDKAYKTLSNLNFHLKSHEKALPYICAICAKGFMRKEYHEAHMNNHKGIKNFSCPVCDKKFVSQKNLDAHLKYHEGTVKGNTCNVCKKVITSSFEEHLRVHSNLKEFECTACDMKFNTKNSLSKHNKRKHLNAGRVT